MLVRYPVDLRGTKSPPFKGGDGRRDCCKGLLLGVYLLAPDVKRRSPCFRHGKDERG